MFDRTISHLSKQNKIKTDEQCTIEGQRHFKFTITIMADGVNSVPQFNSRAGKEDTKQMLIVIFHLHEGDPAS